MYETKYSLLHLIMYKQNIIKMFVYICLYFFPLYYFAIHHVKANLICFFNLFQNSWTPAS